MTRRKSDKPDYISLYKKPGPKKKIICVDDVKFKRLTLETQLGELYKVITVVTSAQVFEALKNIDADLIILDVNMPDMDGFDTLVKLKRDKRYSEIPVFFVTNRSDKDSFSRAIHLGAEDYFVKPFDTVKLIDSMEKSLYPVKKPVPAEAPSSDNSTENKSDVKPNILIVDDITSMLRTIYFCLHNDYNVTLLSKPEVVIEFLQNNDVDLILLDLLMPVLSGFDLVPMIKALPKYADVPIVIISTEGDYDTVSKTMILGVKDFIKKPFTEIELNEKVEKHLRNRK
ncbi:MAG: response regulator [Treponema sp.]|nr:response regulator [Treponema sp.]